MDHAHQWSLQEHIYPHPQIVLYKIAMATLLQTIDIKRLVEILIKDRNQMSEERDQMARERTNDQGKGKNGQRKGEGQEEIPKEETEDPESLRAYNSTLDTIAATATARTRM